MAVTVAARNMEYWLTHIRAHIESGTSKEIILQYFPMLLKGVVYIADASANKFVTPRAEAQKKGWGHKGRGCGGAIFCPPEHPQKIQ